MSAQVPGRAACPSVAREQCGQVIQCSVRVLLGERGDAGQQAGQGEEGGHDAWGLMYLFTAGVCGGG